MAAPRSIVVVQTAFVGDVILTLPLFQLLRDEFPRATITAVTVPVAEELFAGYPAVDRVIVYDKRGADSGLRGFLRTASLLRASGIDAALIPHRSLRSALLCRIAGIPLRIGFDTSAGRILMTHTVPYAGARSEILRNLSLALPLGVRAQESSLPRLYPSPLDRLAVDAFMRKWAGSDPAPRAPSCIALAPGSVWNTKRWPESKFNSLIRLLLDDQFRVVLIGGPADRDLCARLCASSRDPRVADASGRFSLLESAELIGRCAALVSNDSAPVHMAAAMGIPVVAIFGPTLPEFGFAPSGPRDRIVETHGLSCRPCSIHGGNRCPTGTFDCMNLISAGLVRDEVQAVAHQEV
jgi:heptosyltransferase II